jgi:gas vesicle protein
MGKTNFLLGFLAGAVAGAAAGILMAPRKGSVTRSRLSKNAVRAGENLKQSIEEFVESTKEQYTLALAPEQKPTVRKYSKSKKRKKLPSKNQS